MIGGQRGRGELQEEILREQVRLAMSQLPTMQTASFIVSLVIAYTARHSVSLANLCVWVFMVLAVVVSRIVFHSRFVKVRDDLFNGGYWQNFYLVLASVSGAVWGLSAFIIFPAGNAGLISLFVLVMASLSAATTVSHSSLRLAPAAWASLSMLPYAIRCAVEGGQFGYTTSILIVVYLMTIIRYSLIHHDTITSAISLKFKNLDLLQEVRRAAGVLESRVEERTTELRQSHECLLREMEERTLLEDELREREEKYRELVEQANSIVLRWDTNGVIRFVNEFALRFFGYSEQELLGKNVMGTIVALTSREGVDLGRMIKDICRDPQAYAHNENENLCKNGDRVWVSWTNQSIVSESGELIEVLSIGQDMTERKRAQEALRESEKKYRLLADHVSDVIFTMDLNLKLTYLSPSAERLYGWTPEELQVLNPSDYMTPASAELVSRVLAEEIARQHSPEADPNRVRTVEIEQVRKDGTPFWTEVSARFLYNGDGDTVGIIGSTRDITERRRAEKALHESKERFRQLFDGAADAFFVTDLQGQLVDVNRVACDSLGYTRDELLQMTVPDIEVGQQPDDMARLWERIGQGQSTTAEGVHRRRDGSTFPVEIHITPFTLDDRPLMFGAARDITYRKQAEEALLLEKQFSELLLDSLPGIFYLYDSDLRLCRWNRNHETTTGFSAEEIRGRFIGDWFPVEADRARILKGVRSVLDKGTSGAQESNLANKDGRLVPYIFSGVRLDTPEGPMMMGVGIDISDRVKAEQALRESEEKYRLITSCVPDLIWAVDLAGRFTYASPSVERTHGYTVEEFLGLSIEDTHTPKSFSRISEAIADELKRVQSPDADRSRVRIVETEEVRKEGSVFAAEVSGTFLWSDDGRPVGIIGMTRDITERKRAQEEMSHLRNYLANIIDSMPSMLVGVDAAGRVTQWNAAAERLTGISPGEIVGQGLRDALPSLSHVLEQVEEAVLNQSVRSKTKTPHQAGGEMRYEDITVYPLTGAGMTGAVIRIDDVTERVRLDEMMIQSEKMLSVGALAAGMAHEINNPLGVILQASQNVLRRVSPELPGNTRAAEACGTTLGAIRNYLEQREIMLFLEDIRNSGVKATQIVENMLAFSQMTETPGRPTNLADLLDRAVELAASDYDLKKGFDFREIEIVREYHPNVPMVICQASKIQQVFLNILLNGAAAMMAAKASNRAPRFVLRVLRDDSMAQTEIEDNGLGMDESMRRRIFEPFFTTKDPGEGTGLGLSVSYFIITEEHGGSLTVESKPGGGTRFIIRLPAGDVKGAGGHLPRDCSTLAQLASRTE